MEGSRQIWWYGGIAVCESFISSSTGKKKERGREGEEGEMRERERDPGVGI